MSNARHVAAIVVLFAGMLATRTPAEPRPAVAEEVANTYGFKSFDQIDAIRYTFKVDGGPKLRLTRSWEWEPKTNKVTFEGTGKTGNPVKVTFTHGQAANENEAVKEADPGFINDQYWLLFPFHMIWDSGPTITDEGMKKLPQGKGTARKVSVKYTSDGGYTPGDTWELYVGKDGVVKQMEFHHGGNAKPSVVIASWGGYKKAGPLLISTDHRGTADGNPFSVTFSNVAVKLAGSTEWMEAK